MCAVHLTLEVVAPRVGVAVGVLLLPARHHVGEQLVLCERQRRDQVVHVGDARQLVLSVETRVQRYGLEPRRERGRFVVVVLGDVLARPRDGEDVEQLEVVGVHRCHEVLGRPLLVGQLAPLGEALLRESAHGRDGADAVGLGQVGIVALGDDLYLVAQVEQAVVHGRRGEHQHLGSHASADDVLHEAVVAAVLRAVGRLVAEVV